LISAATAEVILVDVFAGPDGAGVVVFDFGGAPTDAMA